jgi:hypothetical protein
MPRKTQLIALLILSILFSGCSAAPKVQQGAGVQPVQATARPQATPLPLASAPPAPTRVVSATPSAIAATRTSVPPTAAVPLPEITLRKGDAYFTFGGKQSFIFMRNLGGYEVGQYLQMLDLMKGQGSQVVRIQLDSLGMGYLPTGELDKTWALNWEAVFGRAAQDGILVLPVFAGWFDWNDGQPDYGYSMWKSNPMRGEAGGLAKTPGELFRSGSPTQEAWLAWLKTLVERWQGKPNILAWEVFSEVNLASGVSEASGIEFVEKAAALIRAADPQQRPITASLAETGGWPNFYRSPAIDFINSHPYPPSGKLDSFIIETVRRYRTTYHKPVLIGEAGLSAAPPVEGSNTLTTAKNARIGIAHAIWAELVSGAMNGRGLYWEDGFAVYFPKLSLNFLYQYFKAETPTGLFAAGVDFSGFEPVPARLSGKISGAALGNDKMILGWFRDAACEPPDWNLQASISGQSASLSAPGDASAWQVDFYDPAEGSRVSGSITVQRTGERVIVPLPDFVDAIAFKMMPLR